MKNKTIYSVIVAAGSGSRMHSEIPKQLMPYGGSTVLETAVRAFVRPDISRIIIVSPQDGSLDARYTAIALKLTSDIPGCPAITIVHGGAERGDSVKAALAKAAECAAADGASAEDVIVMIHDAARPGIDAGIIDRNIEAMEMCRGVVTAVSSVDSVRVLSAVKSSENIINSVNSALKDEGNYPIMNSAVLDRRLVYNVQTPQTFRLADIRAAYDKAAEDGYTGTDDASVAEHAGMEIAITAGSPANRKITTQEDIGMTVRVGTGYDVHKLVPGRDLILCGTPVPYEKGLLGHSDADVATHALMDALLGAAGKGDIGKLFPDSDDKYKDADSLGLLAQVREMLGDVTVNNVDITIIAQEPKLAPYNDRMTNNIAETLGIPASAVNVKATTEEGLGFTGKGEGIAAIATCAIEGRF